MESPQNHKEVASIYRLTRYYSKFVRNYGRIVAPLTKLLKKDAFSWTAEETKSFEHLKEEMCLALVLAMPNFTKKPLLWNVMPQEMELVLF